MQTLTPDITKLIYLAIPILLIQIGLQIYALVDLIRQPSVRGPKWAWAVLIILGELFGPIIYLLLGRKKE
jgi:hypothetical protein